MTYEEKKSKVLEAVQAVASVNIVNLYNDYAIANNYELIYDNCDYILNELFSSPADAITHLHKDYRTYHDYCMFDGCGYLASCNFPVEEGWIYPEDIAKWLMRDDSALYKAIDEYYLDLDYDEMEM